MVSSIRRRERRYLLGATQKATGVRWIGRVTVRVMDVSRVKTSRPVREKAYHGAEKSRLTRRRKRGLRRGRVDRVSLIPEPPATSSNSRHARKVNHSGRKFLWAMRASNGLRKDCERLNKFPRGPLPENSTRQRARLQCKLHCRAKWTRLHLQAEAAGIPPVAAFHASFWKYLLVETSRGDPVAGWDMLLAGLPRGRSPARSVSFRSRTPVMSPVRRRLDRAGRVVTTFENRACRMCGYFGSGPHAWNSCRVIPGTVTGGPRRGRRRGNRG
jgi:hypothetical protein